MSDVRPRALVHRGVVRAAGFLVDATTIGEARARARVLALGDVEVAHVVRDGRTLDGVLLVRLDAPIAIDCARAPGAPLVAPLVGDRGALVSAPLDDDELEALSPSPGAVVHVRAGRAEILVRGEPVDPATWLDVSRFATVDVEPLGAARSAPVAPSPPRTVDVRQALGVASAPVEMRSVAAALAARRSSSARAPQGTPARAEPAGGAPAIAVAAAVSVLAWLASFFGARGTPSPSTSGAPGAPRAPGARPASRALAAVPQPPAGPSWLDRARSQLQDLLARLLVQARLASFLGRRQARYLAELLRALDDDLDKALRWAIPLGGGDGEPGPPALSVPSPRSDLSISLGHARGRAAIGLDGDLFGELRARYRRAFERLSGQGRHDEAAFVLAELLHASEEAVHYLEKHGRLRLAAELAESRGLSPGLVVRQWFLAGDRDRAIALAIRSGAFAQAVAQLEPTHPERAKELRLLWADHLAEAGAFAAAVDVVWSIDEARALARRWIDAAIDVGGPTGARMLARKVRLAPFEQVRDRARVLLDDDTLDARATRRAFADELVSAPPTPETRVLARATARALLAQGDDDARVASLMEASGDDVLRSDLAAARRAPLARDVRPPLFTIRSFVGPAAWRGAASAVGEDGCFVRIGDEVANGSGSHVRSSSGLLLAVFDGEGTGSDTERFGRIVADAVLAAVDLRSDVSLADLTRAAARGLSQANALLIAAPKQASFGALAAVIAVTRGHRLALAHVGDARAYLVRGGVLSALTRDHRLLAELLAKGELTPEAARDFPHQNVVTRMLGSTETVVADGTGLELAEGDVVLLCTDGVHDALADERLAELARAHRSADALATAVRDAVLEAGATDDYAIVAAHVSGPSLAASALPVDDRSLHRVSSDAAPEDAATRVVRRDDAGTLPVLDAALLPGGRLLVALGEAGVRMLAPDGEVLARFLEPAHRLVASDHGDRAIAVATRGDVSRLARIDLVHRRARAWCDVRLSCFAADFDGALWWVGVDDALHAIDARADDWRAVWSTRAADARIDSVVRSSTHVAARFASFGSHEIWIHDLPGPVLRSRRDLGASGVAFSSTGAPLPPPSPAHEVVGSVAVGAHGAWLVREAGRIELHLSRARVLALEGAESARVRAQGDRVVVCDDRGRALVTDAQGEIAHEWRVSP